MYSDYLYNIDFEVKFLGFTCMCIGENTFYHPKFQLYALSSSFRFMQ